MLLLLGLSLAAPVQTRRRNVAYASASGQAASIPESGPTTSSRMTITTRPTVRLDSEQKRRDAVSSLASIYGELESRVLSKGPLSLTREEQFEVSLVRLKLQTAIDSFKRYRTKAPYVTELLDKLKEMRVGLTTYRDYIDRDNYDFERRRRNAEAVARFKARQKVAQLGINVRPPPRRLRDNAPPEIQHRRDIKNLSRRRIKQREAEQTQSHKRRGPSIQQWEPKDLLAAGWGEKRRRM